MILTCPLTQNAVELTPKGLLVKGVCYEPNELVRILFAIYSRCYRSHHELLRDYINDILIYYRFRVYIAYRPNPTPIFVELWATDFFQAVRLAKACKLCLDEPLLYFPGGYGQHQSHA